MRLTKMLGTAAALVLSAVVGGTLIGTAFATETESDGTTTTAGAGTEYCEVFLDELAAQLGTTRNGLTAAGRAAALAAVDAAVTAGDLSEERAATVRERIESADGDACGWFGHAWGRGVHAGIERGIARGFLGGTVFETAADALGIASDELVGALRDEGSLESLAAAQGVPYETLTASILDAVQADLDAAVAEGLSRERADAAIERLTEWLDEGGEVRGLRPGRSGPGVGPFHGPWGDRHGSDGSDDADAEESGT